MFTNFTMEAQMVPTMLWMNANINGSIGRKDRATPQKKTKTKTKNKNSYTLKHKIKKWI